MFLFKMTENVRLAISTLLSSKLRAALTMLGITIGVSSVVILLSVGQAFEGFVVGQFSSFGSNLVAIFGERSSTTNVQQGSSQQPDAQTRATFLEPLSMADVRALSDRVRVPSARYISPVQSLATDVTYGEESLSILVSGVSEDYAKAVTLDIVAGRFLDAQDMAEAARVTVINELAAENLFGEEYPIGKFVKIKGISFEVIGVVDLGPAESDESIVMPITTMYQRLSSDRLPDGDLPVAIIMLQAVDAAESDLLVEQITQVLRAEHKLEPDDKNDFQVFAQTAFLESLSAITGLITAFLAVIASISLLVGGIGIMNIMLVTVTERTREIGLRKAVGARNSDILMQFIIEAITLSFIGGALGTGLAYIGSVVMTNAIDDFNIVVRPSSIILATVVSLSIGVFFGAFPANRAAKMNPIDALRFE